MASLYALAAILGLFLHSPGEPLRARHVCEAGNAHLERDDDPARSIHDEAHCALCHTVDRLVVALGEPALALDAVAPASDAILPPLLEVRSAFEPIERSRSPPVFPVVS
ncbi:hypothetical protein HY251_09740 [bacterium]|nr:hypothetical protein [bacterium]